eukprot:GHRR01033086.1.p1 GENE.GHRR01033086.1~~GHRR01033086.1.p1  ORF type:complete len:178 (+),score=65.62 GHRR01033086.1:125-658(+)
MATSLKGSMMGVAAQARRGSGSSSRCASISRNCAVKVMATSKFEAENPFVPELRATAAYIAQRGKGILASDESNATTGKRLESVGVDNTEDNRRAWRELLYTAPGLGQYISGAIMFDETLYQKSAGGQQFVDILKEQGIVPGIKVDTGLQVCSYSMGRQLKVSCSNPCEHHAQSHLL